MWGKHLISQLEITEKFCYYPPPPTESRRLMETTEKTQEIQQAQLGSSETDSIIDKRCILIVGPVVNLSANSS